MARVWDPYFREMQELYERNTGQPYPSYAVWYVGPQPPPIAESIAGSNTQSAQSPAQGGPAAGSTARSNTPAVRVPVRGKVEYTRGYPEFVTEAGKRYNLTDPDGIQAYYREVYPYTESVLRAAAQNAARLRASRSPVPPQYLPLQVGPLDTAGIAANEQIALANMRLRQIENDRINHAYMVNSLLMSGVPYEEALRIADLRYPLARNPDAPFIPEGLRWMATWSDLERMSPYGDISAWISAYGGRPQTVNTLALQPAAAAPAAGASSPPAGAQAPWSTGFASPDVMNLLLSLFMLASMLQAVSPLQSIAGLRSRYPMFNIWR